MRRIFTAIIVAISAIMLSQTAPAQTTGPYKILTTANVGGDGGFDYVYADPDGRKLYITRLGPTGHVSVFDLDTLKPAGEIDNASGHGVAVDTKTGHGFVSSKSITEFDANTLATIKTIDVQGGPDGILDDPLTGKIYVLSHGAPNVTVINAATGTVTGTIDLGGGPEQAVNDGNGHLYIDLEDKGSIAVIDTKTDTMTGTLDLAGKGNGCAGLALDAKNGILFAACRMPQVMVVLKTDGTILTTLPIGRGCDGAVFNPDTMEAFSSQGDGTLTVIKESSPTSFAVEQTVTTPMRAKVITLDSKTDHLFSTTAQYLPPPAPPTPPAAPATPAAATPSATTTPTTQATPGMPGQGPGPGRYPRGVMVPGSFSILEIGK
jgi:YVTN family beta-propeller protein